MRSHPLILPLLSITCISLVAPLRSEAQPASDDASAPAWTVQTDPLTDALGISQVLVERRVTSHLALYIGPSLHLFDSPLLPDDEEGYKAYGTEQGARWFFDATAPFGWWAGMRLIVADLRYEGDSRIGGYISALGGYAWLLADRWIVSAAVGVSYFDYDIGDVGVQGVKPGAHTGIGFAF